MEATIKTMVEGASGSHMPVTTGGKGKAAVRAFGMTHWLEQADAELAT